EPPPHDLAFPDDDAPPADERVPDATELWPDDGDLRGWLGDDPTVDAGLDGPQPPREEWLSDALQGDHQGDVAERVLRERFGS
ncbi:MAG: hypothetical protein QOG63_1439, partial [Thermoleophilaceae bacterium]|nr:hypothetical protein [Thermoleophilaceae bacterium]